MIRTLKSADLPSVMEIWLEGNRKAHAFVPEEYWQSHYENVKEMLPQAEVYVYEADGGREILGFIGFTDSYIAGIFVKEGVRSRGIGKQLLDYGKGIKSELSLSVYQKNNRAVLFYQREQFSIQTEQVDESTGEKEFVMQWRK